MKTRNIFKTLAMVLLLPAMLLTTACSSDDDDAINNNENIVNNTEQTAQKGYPLQVTVNVTREGAAGSRDTRATYTDNGDKTGSLAFSAGDKLFVEGSHASAGKFAGTLDYVPASGTFSGTITTENPYSGTADALLTTATALAALLPVGYGTPGYFSIDEKNGYDAELNVFDNKAFATSKAAAVEQFSDEYAFEYSGGFTLSPYNAILYFTISGLSASTSVDVALTGPSSLNITGSVTTNLSGEATFAVGVDGNTNLSDLALTVGGNAIALGGSKTLTAGKIYNVNRAVGALAGKFSVSSTKQVYFSKGNLQATTTNSWSTWTFSFMEHQYSTVETANQNVGDYYSSQNTVSLFGWGTSGQNHGANAYQPYSTNFDNSNYYAYGNASKNLYDDGGTADWGYTMGSGWRTLTIAEWAYLFSTRTNASSKWALATVAGVKGLVILPDTWFLPDGCTFTATITSGWTTNSYNVDKWCLMEAAGAVFLPAAGYRYGVEARQVGTNAGYYWSSSVSSGSAASNLTFYDEDLNPGDVKDKYYGLSVRLVKDAN